MLEVVLYVNVAKVYIYSHNRRLTLLKFDINLTMESVKALALMGFHVSYDKTATCF